MKHVPTERMTQAAIENKIAMEYLSAIADFVSQIETLAHENEGLIALASHRLPEICGDLEDIRDQMQDAI